MSRAAPLLLIAVLVPPGCAHTDEQPTPTLPTVTLAQATRMVPDKVRDRAGWADDILVAIRLVDKEPTAERVCAVVAVIDQESGFVADPKVSGLGGIVRQGLKDKLARLGPLADPALAALLAQAAPGSSETFAARIDALQTERDLDRLYRDLAASLRAKAPGSFAVAAALVGLLGTGSVEDWNPVTTAGSMQVKVAFARARAAADGDADDAHVRELLYTRGGGVRFGTARLLGYAASYTDVVFRFADYNAGVYASRNAAFQEQLADLTGTRLALDGDVLAWDDDGEPRDGDTHTLRALLAFAASAGLSERTVRRDARKEKERAFEETDTWRTVRSAWARKHGSAAPYARIPTVALSSPKLKQPRTTAWFATNVKRRYDACRARA